MQRCKETERHSQSVQHWLGVNSRKKRWEESSKRESLFLESWLNLRIKKVGSTFKVGWFIQLFLWTESILVFFSSLFFYFLCLFPEMEWVHRWTERKLDFFILSSLGPAAKWKLRWKSSQSDIENYFSLFCLEMIDCTRVTEPWKWEAECGGADLLYLFVCLLDISTVWPQHNYLIQKKTTHFFCCDTVNIHVWIHLKLSFLAIS